jgi:hypothetical protein
MGKRWQLTRPALALAALAVIVLVVAACGGDDDDGGGEPNPQNVEATGEHSEFFDRQEMETQLDQRDIEPETTIGEEPWVQAIEPE